MDSKYITFFYEGLSAEKNFSGGKGSSLAFMTKLGLNVPKGFIVTSYFFKEVLKYNNLYYYFKKIHLKNYKNKNNNFLLRYYSRRMQKKIMNVRIPDFLKDKIMDNLFFSINSKEYIIRSSAVLEDSINYSWAGILDSYKTFKKDKVIYYLKKCWASYFSERAMIYKKNNGILNFSDMGVVVQEFVNGDFSGTLFTSHPESKKSIFYIETIKGNGENLVSGKINPEKISVSKKNLKILEGNDFLPEKLLNELISIGRELEEFFNLPQDIEWSYFNKQVFFIQSRPIVGMSNKKSNKNYMKKFKGFKLAFVHDEYSSPPFYSHMLSQAYLGYKIAYTNILSKSVFYIHEESLKQMEDFGMILFFDKFRIINIINDAKNLYEKWEAFVNENKFNIFNLNLKELYNILKKHIEFKTKFVSYYKYSEKMFVRGVEKYLYDRKNFSESQINLFETYLAGNNVIIEDKKINQLLDNVKLMTKEKYFLRECLNNSIIFDLPILNRIAKLLEWPHYLIECLTLDEIEELCLENKRNEAIYLRNATRRHKGYLRIYDGTSLEKINDFYEFDLLKLNNEKHENMFSDNDLSEELGIIQGIVEGKVVVFPYTFYNDFGSIPKKIKKMRKGNILIARSTGPELIGACKKASAIITEEGGMTSHAALIAREFNIPCIVGVRGALSKYKDGDYIRVDSINKIISKIQ